MENPTKMDDLGVPLFPEISIISTPGNLKHPSIQKLLVNFQLDGLEPKSLIFWIFFFEEFPSIESRCLAFFAVFRAKNKTLKI